MIDVDLSDSFTLQPDSKLPNPSRVNDPQKEGSEKFEAMPENRSTTARSGKAKGPKHFSQPRKDVRDCKHCGRKTKSASGFCVHCLSERVESHKAETCQPEFVFVISDTNPKWGRFVSRPNGTAVAAAAGFRTLPSSGVGYSATL